MRAALTAVCTGLLLVAVPTAAASRAASRAHTPILGAIPHLPGMRAARSTAALHALTTSCGSMSCSSYEGAIDQYFSDVAHDSGRSTNVYSVATQYSDSTGPIAYSSTFGGSYVDTSAFPASGCNDGIGGAAPDPVCLSDLQIQDEIQRVIAARSWPTGPTDLYFVMLPSSVGVCYDSADCTTTTFCAYHSYLAGPVAYAVEPFDASIGGCSDGNSPNGTAADATINTISHEHNEAITDPWGNAWLDSSGNEIGDICAWQFGSQIGSTTSGPYNQVIDGHHYWLQTEWSNSNDACVQQYPETTGLFPSLAGGGPLSLSLPCTAANSCSVMRTNTVYAIYWMPSGLSAPTNSAPPTISGAAAVGKTLTSSTGTWTGSPTSYGYQWRRCAADGTGCTNIAGATASTYLPSASDANHVLLSEVRATNAGGSSAFVSSSATQTVVPVPYAWVAPAVSGVPAVGQTLSTTEGTWNSEVAASYRWLRCAADATGCTAISGATYTTYQLKPADAGHTIEASVSAANAASTTTVETAPTALVLSAPTATKIPRIVGRPKVGRRLHTTTGAWDSAPRAYRYQWFRCNAAGRHCRRIERATRPTYRVKVADGRHRLRVLVTAVNAAGRKSVRSHTTRIVSARAARRHRILKPARRHG